MNLLEFHQLVDSESGEQGSSDPFIANAVRRGVLWIERNFTFQYMRGQEDFTLAVPSGDIPETVELNVSGQGRLKNIADGSKIRKTESGITRFTPFEQVQGRDVISYENSGPLAYERLNNSQIRPTAKLTEALTAQMELVRFTLWPTVSTEFEAFEHWLLDYADDLLMACSHRS